MPFRTLVNGMVGYILAIGLYMGLYYGDIWDARRFPFLSPQLFSQNSDSHRYIQYNQSQILNSNYEIDQHRLQKHGLPWMTTSHVLGMTAVNIAITAAISHMCLWHWNDIKSAFEVIDVRRFFKKNPNWKFWNHKEVDPMFDEAEDVDPHHRLMQAYENVPSWWFASLWVISALLGFITSRLASSTLEWWAFILAVLISSVTLTIFAALNAIFGFPLKVESFIQMIGAYLLPGRPLANLYFSAFGYNSLQQGISLLGDLKLGQYVHLAPKCTFTVQVVGTTIGSLMAYIMMENITTEKRTILLAIQGTNVWSGQTLQKLNSAVSISQLNKISEVEHADWDLGYHMGWLCKPSLWLWFKIPNCLSWIFARPCSSDPILVAP
jgi:OPT family oligopeptide transporter